MAKPTGIKIDVDMAEFNNNLAKYRDALKAGHKASFDKAFRSALDNPGVRYSPPSINGSRTIPESYYFRPYIDMIKCLRSDSNDALFHPAPGWGSFKASLNGEDMKKVKEGYRYKVFNTKAGHKRGIAFGYARTQTEAEKLSRIANRGLAKVMWAVNIDTIGLKSLPSIKKLMAKSPRLQQLTHLNSVDIDYKPTEIQGEAENQSDQISHDIPSRIETKFEKDFTRNMAKEATIHKDKDL